MYPVLHIFRADESSSSASVDEIVELDLSRNIPRLDGVSRADWTRDLAISGFTIFECDGIDFDAVESLRAGFLGMSEKQFICFGPNDVPGIIFRSSDLKEISV